MTKAESILLAITIYLFSIYFLKKEGISVKVPVIALLLFLLAGTFKHINNQTTKELIVYNTVGSSVIGIRTGNVLNLYSDTITGNPEITRHCATRGLKIRMIKRNKSSRYIKTDKKNILICNQLNNNILKRTSPEILIFTGVYPDIEKSTLMVQSVKKIIISPEVSSGFSLPGQLISKEIDTIHYVRKSGGYLTRL